MSLAFRYIGLYFAALNRLDADNSESNLLKAAKYSPTDLNAREMFRQKETIFVRTMFLQSRQ